MPSSPADPHAVPADPLPAGPLSAGPLPAGPLPAGAVLRALARAYDEALAAASSGDFDACARLLDAGDALLAAPLVPGADASLPELHQAACSAHARLQSVLRGLHADTAEELGRVRTGRKALAGYGGEREIGGRVQSRV
jgi:hypothetical protein